MAEPASISFPSDLDPLSELARVCRDLFLLRARGRDDEAAVVEATRLDATLKRVRSHHGDDARAEDRIATVFATEQERVTNAAVLTELLAPALAERLRELPPVPTPFAVATTHTREGASSRAEHAAAASFVSVPSAPAPRGEIRRATPPAPLQIADLLDDMLAQQRRASPSRQAS